MPVLGSYIRALLLIVAVLIAARMHAQESEIPARLTLDNAIGLAIGRNPALAAEKNEIQATEGDRVAASKRLNPTFSLQFEDYPISAHPGRFFDVQETDDI